MFQDVTAVGPTNEYRAEAKWVTIHINGALNGATGVLEFKGQDGQWRPLIDDNGKHLWTGEASRTLMNPRPIDLRMNFAGGPPACHLEMR